MSFQYIKPTEEQTKLMQEFRDKFEDLENDLKNKVITSRGLSIAITKLEEASFWINKAITHND